MVIERALDIVDEMILNGTKFLDADLTGCWVCRRLDEASVDATQLFSSHLPACLASLLSLSIGQRLQRLWLASDDIHTENGGRFL